MYRESAGHAAVGPLSTTESIKQLRFVGQVTPIGCSGVEDPPAGPSPGIKAAIWTPFLS